MADPELLESLGFHPNETRWAMAEHRFLEVFYGKEFLTAYENLSNKKQVLGDAHNQDMFPIPSNLLPKSLLTATSVDYATRPFYKHVKNTDGDEIKIIRPRTAELTAEQKSRLDQFRELDLIAFNRPKGLGTPRPTPITTAGTERSPTKEVLTETIDQTLKAFKRHTSHKLSEDAESLLESLLHQATSQHSKQQHQKFREKFNNLDVFSANNRGSMVKNTTAVQGIRDFLRSDVFPKYGASSDVRDHFDGHLIHRKLVKKYQLPKTILHRRLTPLPNNTQLKSGNQQSILKTEDELAQNNQPTIGELLSDEVDETNTIVGTTEVVNEDQISKSSTAVSVGHIFPLDYFLDHDWISHLEFRILTEKRIPCMSRYNTSRYGSRTLSFSKLIEATQNPQDWHPCHIVELNISNRTVLVQWDGISETEYHLKNCCEIWMPHDRDTLETLRMRLENAQRLRCEFEKDLALAQTVSIAKQFLKPFLPPFPKKMVDRILQNAAESFLSRSLTVDATHPRNDGLGINDASDDSNNMILDWQKEDECLSLLSKTSTELCSLFIDAELKALISRNRHFLTLLPSLNDQDDVHAKDHLHPPKTVTVSLQDQVNIRSQLEDNLSLFTCSPQFLSILLAFKSEIEDLFPTSPISQMKQGIVRPVGSNHKGKPNQDVIVPLLDPEFDTINYSVQDFIDASGWFQSELAQIVTERIPATISKYFAKGMNYFGLPPEPLDTEISPFISFNQRVNAYSSIRDAATVSLFQRLGKFISFMGSSISSPLLYNATKSVRSLMEKGSLRIRLELHCALKDGSLDFHYDADLDKMATDLKTSFARWIHPLDGLTVASYISAQPENYGSFQELAEQLIEDSIQGAKEHLSSVSEYLKPLISDRQQSFSQKIDVDEFLVFCQDFLMNVNTIEKYRSLRLVKIKRGMFVIDPSALISELQEWQTHVIEQLIKETANRMRKMSEDVISRCNITFSIPTPTTFDETRAALRDLKDMNDTIQWISDQENGLRKLKDFMDAKGWVQADEDFGLFIQARLYHDDFKVFVMKRSQEVRLVSEELLSIIHQDLDALLALWATVDTMVQKICAQPIRLRHLAYARRKSSVTSPSYSDGEHDGTNGRISDSEESHGMKKDDPVKVPILGVSQPSATPQAQVPVLGSVIQVDDTNSSGNGSIMDASAELEPMISNHSRNPTGNFLAIPDSSRDSSTNNTANSNRNRKRRSSLSFSVTPGTTEDTIDPIAALEQALVQIAHTLNMAAQIRQKAEGIESGPKANELNSTIELIESRQQLLETLVRIQKNLDTWRISAISSLNIIEVTDQATQYLKIMEDSPLAHTPMLQTSKELLKMYLEIELPLIKRLRNPNFNSEHISAIQRLVRFQFNPEIHGIQDIEDNLRRTELLALGMHLEPIEASASKEQVIMNVIAEINERYCNMPIEIRVYDSDRSFSVISSLNIYISVLESDILTIGMLISNVGMEKHMVELKPLERKLQTALNTMREWEAMQPLMISVHGVFESEEVRAQLAVELRRFRVFETGYRVLMSHVEKYPIFSELIEANGDLPTSITDIRNGLRKVIDDVQGWLDGKRFVFPRLFFLSDQELLELVSVAKEPSTIKRQLSRYFFFDDVTYTTSKDKETVVTGVREGTEECLLLANPISIRGLGVEQWLAKLEGEVRFTLKKSLVSKLTQLNFEEQVQPGRLIYERMVYDAPPQICLLVFHIMKTSELENAITGNDVNILIDFAFECREDIVHLTSLLKQSKTKSITNTWKALLAVSLHYRDWAQELLAEKNRDISSYSWLKGLRYVFQEEDDTVMVQQFYSKIQYGFEYLGSSRHFFSLNISRRSFSSIWGALDMKMGILAYGPAAASKEECVQDFARAVGRFVIFFNCSVGVSPVLLTRLITGMAMTSSFLLLSKFETLSSEAAGVVWNGINSLREISERKDIGSSVSFLGRILKLPAITTIPLFATITSKSCTDTTLAANSKSYLKPLFLSAPDLHASALTYLAVAGFAEFQDLSKRLTTLFVKINDQLSCQTHYDFGLRTLRTVIRVSEAILSSDPKVGETQAIVVSLQKYILPKLIFDDIPIFSSILSTTFDDGSLIRFNDLMNATSLDNEIADAGRQFRDVVGNCQHGIVLGRVGIGKSSLIRDCGEELDMSIKTVNPRAVTREYLFGFEESTGYQKGIFETILSSLTRKQRTLVVLEGSLETSWFDPMLSLLQKDECGSLCLANGKRISIPDEITFMIETESLENASTSIIGLFNVIFLRSEWNWRIALASWFRKLDKSWTDCIPKDILSQIQIVLNQQFSMHMENVFLLASDVGMKLKPQIAFKTCLDIIECLLLDMNQSRLGKAPREKLQSFPVEDIFYYAIIWSFGANFSLEKRGAFDSFIRKELRHSCSTSRLAVSLQNYPGQVFDLSYTSSSGVWSSNAEHENIYPSSNRLLTHQRDIVRMLLAHKKHAMIIGDFCTKKTSLAALTVKGLVSNNHQISAYAFPLNQASSTNEIISILQKALVPDGSKNADVYIPPNGGDLVCLVDDLQACPSNNEGSRMIWEFLRQLVDYNSYWANPQTCRKIANVSILGILNLFRNGVIILPERFLRHFGVVYFNSEDIMEETGYQFKMELSQKLVLSGIPNPQARIHGAIHATVGLLKMLKKRFILSSERPLYFFSPSDLVKVFHGLLLADASYFRSPDALFDLWSHEFRRTFADRISEEDTFVFDDCFDKIALQYFHTIDSKPLELWTDMTIETVYSTDDNDSDVSSENISDEASEQGYDVIRRATYRDVEEQYIHRIFNHWRQEVPQLFSDTPHLSLFPDSSFNFARLCRALSAPDALAAIVMCRFGQDMSLPIIKTVALSMDIPLEHFSFHLKDLEEWRQFLRKQVTEAGLKDKAVIICVSLHSEVQTPPEVWGDLCSMLDGAWSRHLWSGNEYEDLLNKFYHQYNSSSSVQDQSESNNQNPNIGIKQQPGMLETALEWSNRLKKNIKLIIRLNADDNGLQQQILKHPFIICRSMIQIYRKYSYNDYKYVGRKVLESLCPLLSDSEIETITDLNVRLFLRGTVGEDKSKCSIWDLFAAIKWFTERWSLTQEQLKFQKMDLEAALKGIQTLTIRFQSYLEEGMSELHTLPVKLNDLTENVKNLKAEIEQNRNEARHLSERIQEKRRLAIRLAFEHEQEILSLGLAEAKSEYDKRVKNLLSVEKKDIEDLKTFVVPPLNLSLIADGLCLLFDRPMSWGETRKLLSSRNFFQRMLDLDLDTVTEGKLDQLVSIVEQSGFVTEKGPKVSAPIRVIGLWIKALVRYKSELRKKIGSQAVDRIDSRHISAIDADTVEDEAKLKTLDRALNEMDVNYQRTLKTLRELIGRLTLLKEVFSPKSIFAASKPDRLSENQWIQQAFHQDSSQGVYFEYNDLSILHQAYQDELLNLERQRQDLDTQLTASESCLEDMKDILGGLNETNLSELLKETKDVNPITDAAKSILCEILGVESLTSVSSILSKLGSIDIRQFVRSNSARIKHLSETSILFQKVAFYDSKLVTSSAISPYQTCPASFLIRDAILKALSFNVKHERIMNLLEDGKRKVLEKKSLFNAAWTNIYKDNAEFWTFEVILEKHKELCATLSSFDSSTLIPHINAVKKNKLLARMLLIAAASAGIHEQDAFTQIESNPKSLIDGLIQVHLNNTRLHATVSSRLRTDSVNNLSEDISRESKRLYFDIVKYLPEFLRFKILIALDDKALCRAMQVSTIWRDAINQQHIWKWMSHKNGWGLSFNYPKGIDWILLHHSLVELRRRRLANVLESFRTDISNFTGQRAQKRLVMFLKRIPEYVHMERLDSNSAKKTSDLVNLELANEMFNGIEDIFAEVVSTDSRILEDEAVNNAISPFKRILVTVLSADTGEKIGSQYVHELIVEKAGKIRSLHPTLDKTKKLVLKPGGERELKVEYRLGIPFEAYPTDDDTFVVPEQQPHQDLTCVTLFHLLAQYFKVILAYHRGNEMGKYIQFQHRFIFSQRIVASQLSERIKDIDSKINTLTGDLLFAGASLTYLTCLSETQRKVVMRDFWQMIRETYPIRQSSHFLDEYAPSIHLQSHFYMTDFIRLNMTALINGQGTVLIHDPHRIGRPLLSEICEKMAKDVLQFDAASQSVMEMLQLYTAFTGVICIFNVDNNQALFDRLITFNRDRNANHAPLFIFGSSELNPTIDVHITRIDFTLDESALYALLLDTVLSAANPAFFVAHKNIVMRIHQSKEMLLSWFTGIVARCRHIEDVDDSLMYEVVSYQQRASYLEEEQANYQLVERNLDSHMKSYNDVVRNSLQIWELMRNLKQLHEIYEPSAIVLLDLFKESIRLHHLQADSEGHLQPFAVQSFLDDLLSRAGNRLAWSIRMEHRTSLFIALIMIALKFKGSLPDRDESILLSFLEKRQLCQSSSETFTEWVTKDAIGLLVDRPALLSVIQSLTQGRQNPASLWKGKLADIFEKRLSPMQKLFIHLLFVPQTIDISLESPLMEIGVWTKEAREDSRLLTAAQDSSMSMVFIFSEDTASAFRKIVQFSETFEDAHLQLSVLNERDKEGTGWMQKFQNAASNGSWVMLKLDSYWAGQFEKIYRLSRIQKHGYKIWIVVHPAFENLIPSDSISDAFVIFADEAEDEGFISKRLDFLFPSNIMFYYPSFTVLLRFHYMLLRMIRSSQISSQQLLPTEAELLASWSLISYGASKKMPFETTARIIIGSVYGSYDENDASAPMLQGLWSESEVIVEHLTKQRGIRLADKMTRDQFLLFFGHIKHELFSVKSCMISQYGHSVHVPVESAKLSRELVGLLKNGTVVRDQYNRSHVPSNMDIKKKLASFLKMLPSLLNVRLIFENIHGRSQHHTRLYLLEEANNFVRLLRRVRSDMNILLTSFTNGYPTASSKKTFEALLQNKVSEPWIRRSHPSSKPLDRWIVWLTERISYLEKWILCGRPHALDSAMPFSLRSFLHMILDMSQQESMGSERQAMVLCPYDPNHNAAQQLRTPLDIILTGLYVAEMERSSNDVFDRISKHHIDSTGPFLLTTRVFTGEQDISQALPKGELMIELTRPPSEYCRLDRASMTDWDRCTEEQYNCPVFLADNHMVLKNQIHDESRPNYLFNIPLVHTMPKSVLTMFGVHGLVDSGKIESVKKDVGISRQWNLDLDLIEDNLSRFVLDTQAHVTVYMCSSFDTQMERQLLSRNVICDLSHTLSRHRIDFNAVDLKQNMDAIDKDASLQYLEASLCQIKRCAFFVGVFGAKLGPLISFKDFAAFLSYKGIDPQEFAYLGPKFSLCEAEVALAINIYDPQHCERGTRQFSFYLRDPSFPRSVPKSFRAQFEYEDASERNRAISFWSRCSQQFPESCFANYPAFFASVEGHSVRIGGLETLERQLRAELLKSVVTIMTLREIRAKRGQIVPGIQDADFFAGRDEIINGIKQRVQTLCSNHDPMAPRNGNVPQGQMTVIRAASGIGKTALLSKLCKVFISDGYLVLDNFVRSWAGSFEVEAMLRRFCIMIHNFLGESVHKFPTEFPDLKQHFTNLLQDVVLHGQKIIVVVDGIDRLVTNQNLAAHSSWIPSPAELGNDAYANIFWLFSLADETTIYESLLKYQHGSELSLPQLSDADKKSIISHRARMTGLKLDTITVASICEKESSVSPLFLKVFLEELRHCKADCHAIDMARMGTIADAFEYFFDRVESHYGIDLVKKLFIFLSYARNGLREVEAVSALGIDLVKWNYVFESIREYVTKTTSGNIIPFHEQFTAAIKMRYVKDGDENLCHKQLSDFYMTLCKPHDTHAWSGNSYTRSADITYHQLRAQSDITDITSVMCTLGYITAVFAANRASELPAYFSEAIKMAVMQDDDISRAKLTDYSFFVERHAEFLSVNPYLALSISLSLPEGFCSLVRKEALQNYEKKTISNAILRTCSVQEEQLEMIAIGQHPTDIIRVVVLPLKSVGKCCLSVSRDCTVRAWNIDTFLFIRDLLRSPIGADYAVDVCFSLNQAEIMAVGTQNGHILGFNLESGTCIARLESSYSIGSRLFFSEDLHGVWQRKEKQKCLTWTPLNGDPSIPDVQKLGSSIGKIHRIVARSDDGQRVSLLVVDKRRYIVIFGTKRMSEICRFVEDNVSDTCFGHFSPSKDLLGVLLVSGDIMVWKVDNHSRLSLVRVPMTEKVSNFAITADDKELLFTTQSGMLSICTLENGRIVKNVAVGDKIILSNICIATSKGRERMLLSYSTKLCTCDTQTYLRSNSYMGTYKSTAGDVPTRHKTGISGVFHVIRNLDKSSIQNVISVSRDGHLRIWHFDETIQKYAPVADTFIIEDIGSCRIFELLDYAIITSGTAALLWSIVEKRELLRITHNQVLKDAWLAKNRQSDSGLTLYTWAIDGKLRAWKIYGRPSVVLTYHPDPLFTLDATMIPKFPLSQDKTRILIAQDCRILLGDANTGKAIWTMNTNHNEPILSLSWCDFGSRSSLGVMYTTKTSLYKNDELWSYGGALGDTISIQHCLSDLSGRFLGYSGIEIGELVPGRVRNKSNFTGFVVIMQNDFENQPHHRVAMLRHDSVHVLHWRFMHDPNFIVTIASDNFVRIWDTKQKPSHEPVAKTTLLTSSERSTHNSNSHSQNSFRGKTGLVCAMFPLRSPATSLDVSRTDYLIYVGTDGGDVISFRFEF